MTVKELHARIETLPFWRIFGFELIPRQKVLDLLSDVQAEARREAHREQALDAISKDPRRV